MRFVLTELIVGKVDKKNPNNFTNNYEEQYFREKRMPGVGR